MVPAKRPTDSILGHFRQVHGQLLEHVHYIYLIDLSRLFFDDSLEFTTGGTDVPRPAFEGSI